MTPHSETDDIVIATPRKSPDNRIRILGAASIVGAVLVFGIGFEVKRLGNSTGLANFPIAIGVLGVLSGIYLLLFGFSVPSIGVRKGVLQRQTKRRTRPIMELRELREVLLHMDAANAPLKTSSARKFANQIVLLKVPSSELPERIRRTMGTFPLVTKKQGLTLPLGHYAQSPIDIALAIARAAAACDNVERNIKLLTPEGVFPLVADSDSANGEVIADMAQPAHDRPVDIGTRCIDCGYDLRGQRWSGHCPECGTAVARAVEGRLLRNANLQWLASLQRGAAILAFSLPAIVLLGAGLIWLAIRIRQGAAVSRTALPLAVWTALMCCFIAALGTWLLTTAETSKSSVAPRRRHQIATRCTLGMLVAAIIIRLFILRGLPGGLLVAGAFGVFVCGLMLNAEALFERIPLMAWSKAARLISMMTIVMCMSPLLAINARTPAAGPATTRPARPPIDRSPFLRFVVKLGTVVVVIGGAAALSAFHVRLWLSLREIHADRLAGTKQSDPSG